MVDEQKIVSGIGCLEMLAQELSIYSDLENILLVTGKDSYEKCGAKQQVHALLSEYNVRRISDFDTNPKHADLVNIRRDLQDFKPDAILAIGGGSVLDMAKLISATIFVPEDDIQSIIKGEVTVQAGIPTLISVPTSAGSGSESTHFAVCYLGSDKYSVASSHLLPEMVFLDGSLLCSGSHYMRTCSALDALAQSIESNWAVSATPASREHSSRAFKLALNNIGPFSRGDNSNIVLQNMLEAANEAGKAINISKTTAAHAWSYGFTSMFGIPHGHAVWLTLPKVFELHLEHAEKCENVHVEAIPAMRAMIDSFNLDSLSSVSAGLMKYVNSLNVETDFRKLRIHSQTELSALSRMVNQQRMGNNPVQFSNAEISRIFEL